MKRRLTMIAVDLAWAAGLAAIALAFLGAPDATRTHAAPEAVADPAMAEANRALLRARVAETLATEIAWIKPGAASKAPTAESLRFFLAERAHLDIEADLLERLVAQEARTADGGAARITTRELATVLSRFALERARAATDANIARAAVGFGNGKSSGPVMVLSEASIRRLESGAEVPDDELVYVPDPAAAPARPSVMLRFTGEGQMTAEEFETVAKKIRFKLAAPRDFALALQFAPEHVDKVIVKRLELLADAFPLARTEGMTPVEALIVTYSLASDDWLDFPTDEAKARAMDKATIYPQFMPADVTDVHRVAPYGTGGVLFSSPLEMVFDRAAFEAALDLLERRNGR